ncbi:MAG: hypothetical protein J1E64_10665 [Acetatifactor sp.]|nr:hypothetical protein [Acetatifactor sp.]
MYNINISVNTLIAIIVISITFLVLFKYYIKRKYDSINEYNKLVADKLSTYKENQEQYKKNLEDLGIESKKQEKKIFKIIESTIDIIKGSK